MQTSTLITYWTTQPRRIRTVITALGIAALISVVAVAANTNANVNPAALRMQGWVNDLRDDKLTTQRQQAMTNLEASGAAAVPQLLSALDSDNASQRANAADMLGYIASPSATAALQNALATDAAPTVRRNAAWSLGEIQDASSINLLLEASTADHSQIVRGAAADSLARIRTVLAQSAGVNEQQIGAYAAAPSQGNLVYLASLRDLRVSSDNGKTWKTLTHVLPSQISALAVSPADTRVLYAGIESLGIYKSTDGGTTWNAINNGITLTPGAREVISGIAIDPTEPNIVYIARGVWLGTSSTTFYPVGLMQSRDGGASWQTLNGGTANETIAKLTFRDGQLYGLAGDRVLTLVTPR